MMTTLASGKLTAEDRAMYDFTQHDKLINKLINEKLTNFNSSDVCMDREDIVNICRQHIVKALRDYDPSRGQKLTSYIYMVLDSRIGNMRARFQKKNQNRTQNLTTLNAWSVTGGKDAVDDEGATRSGAFKETVREFMKVEDCLLESMDVVEIYESLPQQRQILFKEFFVEGYTVLEIFQRHPDLGYHKIRSELKALEKIFKTLCEGNVL